MTSVTRLLVAAPVAVALIASAAPAARAQIIRSGPPSTKADTAPPKADPTMSPDELARREQATYEQFHRMNLPSARGTRYGSACDEPVGPYCYVYDDHAEPIQEVPAVTARRKRLIAVLDSLAHVVPSSQWIMEQRIRYLVEDARPADALNAVKECTDGTWWCDSMVGFALHELGEYEKADSVYSAGIAKMLPRDQCMWRDISMLLDPDALQQYKRLACGDPKRHEFEDRAWWFARTLYLMHGNDSRTEHYARMTMAKMLADAGTAHWAPFSDEEREIMLRFGWERAFSRGASGGPRSTEPFSIIGHEPVPSYRYIPAGFVLNNPAVSDSADWRLHLPPVIGRYAPPYAKKVLALEHQKAMFRRGDTALVMVAYTTEGVTDFQNTQVEAALTVSPGDVPHSYQARKSGGSPDGVLQVRAPWGPLIMSTEIAAPAKSVIARARYGMSPPYAVGTRVSVSDLLFFKPYGEFPRGADDAIKHALPTERVKATEKLGVFWESYGTDPAGERMKYSLTVVRETPEAQAGFLRRQARTLGFSRELTPVSVGAQDMSAPGARMTPRALELDISTLPKGRYIVQLELEITGQYVIRAEHPIEIIGP